MTSETTGETIHAEGDVKTSRDRQRSTIGFPYMNLEDARGLAQAIYSHVGQGECDDDQLAPWLGLSPKSSGYRVRLSSARMFGLIDSTTDGEMFLSELGRRIVDPTQQPRASVDAFLQVPLYLAIYNAFKGQALPPAAALERQIIGMGVAEKQKSRARQVFEKSAEQAGFFEQGRNRLVKPGFVDAPGREPPLAASVSEEPVAERKTGGGDGGDLHPLIRGMIQTLPPANSEWSYNQRMRWLTLAASAFDMIYKKDKDDSDDDSIAIARRGPSGAITKGGGVEP